jgi:hypothetical protein
MTGTQSLSAEQVLAIAEDVKRGREFVLGSPQDGPGESVPGVERGEVVTVVIHQSLLHSDRRKRVQLHRAFASSITYGLLRDGTRIPSQDAA